MIERADVVVIGAGLTGVLTALFLSRAGVEVALLEASAVGTGESGRSLGHLDLGVLEYPHRTIRALGDDVLTLFEWTDRAKALLDAEGVFERCGALWTGNQERELEEIDASVRALEARQIPAERWTAEQVAEATGATGLTGGLWLPMDGRLRSDALSVLVNKARAAGVTLVESCHVRRIDDEGSEGVEVETSLGPVHCEVVVLACSSGAMALEPRLEGALLPVREQALRVDGACKRLSRAGQGWTSWGPDDQATVVTGCRWASPHLAVGESDPVVEPRIQAKLEAFVQRHLGPAQVLDRWAWCFTQSRDMLPLIGPIPGSPKRVCAVGFGPNGLALGVAAAHSVARGLVEDAEPVPWMFSSRRLVRWR